MTKTDQPKSLLERWVRVVEIVKKHGGPRLDSDFEIIEWQMNTTAVFWNCDIDEHDYTSINSWVRNDNLGLAVLEKWVREDVAVWAWQKHIDFIPPYPGGVGWYWTVCRKLDSTFSPTDAHILAAEALCECLEVG